MIHSCSSAPCVPCGLAPTPHADPASLLSVTFSSPAGLLSFLSNSKPIPAVHLGTCYISCWGVCVGMRGSVSPSWTVLHRSVPLLGQVLQFHLLAVWLWQTLQRPILPSGMMVPTSRRSAPRKRISSRQAVAGRGDSRGVCGVWFVFPLRTGPSGNSEAQRDQSCSRENHQAVLHKMRVRTRGMARRKDPKISDRNESWYYTWFAEWQKVGNEEKRYSRLG